MNITLPVFKNKKKNDEHLLYECSQSLTSTIKSHLPFKGTYNSNKIIAVIENIIGSSICFVSWVSLIVITGKKKKKRAMLLKENYLHDPFLAFVKYIG